MEETIKILKKRENAVVPERKSKGAAGMDLCACIDEAVTLAPMEKAVLPTGIAVALPGESYVALVFARSGIAIKHGIALSNGVGVIDSDYRGEICVGVVNLSKESYTIAPNERIAQLVVTPVSAMPAVEVDSLDETERGEGGFGSTGRV